MQIKRYLNAHTNDYVIKLPVWGFLYCLKLKKGGVIK